MFRKFQEFADSFSSTRKARQEKMEAERRTRAFESEARARTEAAREARVSSVRIITGDVKYRYAVLDTVRGWAVHLIETKTYDAGTATEQVIRILQERASALGANAVIHTQFHIMRFTIPRGKYDQMPCHEVHAFGTAIKILGPPSDWDSTAQEKPNE